MPFVNDPNGPGQFDISKMTSAEMEVYAKVAARQFLLLEAVKELAALHTGNEKLGGMCNDIPAGVIVEWRIREK